MRLVLDSDVFDVQSEAEALALGDILGSVARDPQRHILLTDPPYVQGAPNHKIDVWLDQHPPHQTRAFRRVLLDGPLAHRSRPAGARASDSSTPRRWHLEGALTCRVERRVNSDWPARVLTLGDAAELLREPTHLVLENKRTDLAFLRMLAGPTDGGTLGSLLDAAGCIETHGGGGDESRKWLEALSAGPPTPHAWRRLLRTWVLFDQDAGDPDARHPSASATKMMEACERAVVAFGDCLSWICLRRREIESYLPDQGLHAEALAAHAPVVQQVITWRADPNLAPHAWAFDLKKGLRGDLIPTLPQADREGLKNGSLPLAATMLKAPFSALTPAEIAALEHGLGDRLGAALREKPVLSWAPDLPAEYDRGPHDQAPRPALIQSLFDRM